MYMYKHLHLFYNSQILFYIPLWPFFSPPNNIVFTFLYTSNFFTIILNAYFYFSFHLLNTYIEFIVFQAKFMLLYKY